MPIYESLAHALIQEHGRGLFLKNTTHSNELGNKMWRWLLIAYGRKLYDLPREMGLPQVKTSFPSGLKEYSFPSLTVQASLGLGISPLELYTYPTMGGFNHAYTPIHVACGLLKFGHEQEEVAKRLLHPNYLKGAYPSRTGQDFATNSDANPYGPQHFGMEPYLPEDFLKADGTMHIVDELGNAAWFPKQYITQALRQVPAAQWVTKLLELRAMHGRWEKRLQAAAAALVKGAAHTRDKAVYLRTASADYARSYLKGVSGVSEMLWAARADATTTEMAKGLRVISSTDTKPVREMYQYIGRPLTPQDFAELQPKQALKILYYAPMDVVAGAIASDSGALASKFFTLTTREHLPMVSNSMSKHGDRTPRWYPDTAESNVNALNRSSTEELRAAWDERMKSAIQQYETAKEWRDRFTAVAEPAVLFLALMCWASTEDDPIPHNAILNVLRAHPSAQLLAHLASDCAVASSKYGFL